MVEFMLHTIHLYKAYNSTDSSMFRVVQSAPKSILEHFHYAPQTLFVLINSHFSHHSSPTPRQPLIYFLSLPNSLLFIFILAHWIRERSPDSSFWLSIKWISCFKLLSLPSALYFIFPFIFYLIFFFVFYLFFSSFIYFFKILL